jgi:SAM-dependent methyltransferase
MSISRKVLREYVAVTPLALALERTVESTLIRSLHMDDPILDLGCGDGIFASLTFDHPVDYGLDPNARELVRARQSGAYVDLLQSTGDSIPLPDGSVGTVFSNSVLEHIRSLDPVCQEVYRVLRSGGYFYFTVPTDRFDHYSNISLALERLHAPRLAEKFRRRYNAFWRHYNYKTPAAWRNYVMSFGFTAAEVVTYNAPQDCRRNDLLVPLGGPGKLLKLTFNRWTVLPGFRRRYLAPLVDLASPNLDEALASEAGGLVLVMARKP